MSASREKQTRQGDSVMSLNGVKTAKELEEKKAEKRSRIMYITIAVIFVIVAVLVLVWRSGIVQKVATAATINNVNYSAAETEYYYRNAYNSFVNQNSSYLSYLGLDTNGNLKTQTNAMSDDGSSWYDYFVDQGLTTMSNVHALNDAADADGFAEWNDDMEAQMQEALTALNSNAESANYSTKQYLSLMYNGLVDQKMYEEQLKLSIRAQAYATDYQDSLTYTDQQIADAYAADTKSFDVVDYQSVTISGAAAATTDADGNAVEATDEEKAAALDTAKKLSDSIYASYQDGGSLSDLADANDTATYNDATGGTYSDSVLMNWLYDDTRKAGDSAILPDEDNATYYVVVFGKRYRNDYNTVDVRHILFQADSSGLDTESDTYDADLQALKDEARQKADNALAEWKAGAATEDSFAELANADSDDTGSNTTGGLYSQVYKGQMVAAFSDWCFDEARKAGDTDVVDTDYGSHVMYFVGQDLPYWQVQVTNSLKSTAYNDWYTAKTENYTATKGSLGMAFVG